jgi:hypothetical protein
VLDLGEWSASDLSYFMPEKKILLHLLGRRLHAQQSGSGGSEEEKKSMLLPTNLISCSISLHYSHSTVLIKLSQPSGYKLLIQKPNKSFKTLITMTWEQRVITYEQIKNRLILELKYKKL